MKTQENFPVSHRKYGDHSQEEIILSEHKFNIVKLLWSDGKLTQTQRIRGSLHSTEANGWKMK